jgi:segregation and condensation protein A
MRKNSQQLKIEDAATIKADTTAVEIVADSSLSILAASVVSAPESTEVAAIVFGRLYDTPVMTMPADLYIPPGALEIYLETFEGPLDLLLYVIRKQNFNILDIPMSEMTLQFLKYVEQIRIHNLDLASEYLLMAALLLEIKSRMLLPSTKQGPDNSEDDPRAELVRRLIEYEQMKLAASEMYNLPQVGRDMFITDIYVEPTDTVALPDVNLVDLQKAWLSILTQAKMMQHHSISREELSVRDHMTKILRLLRTEKFVEFSDLFDISGGIPVVVVNFVALLELAKETLIEITQAEPFAPIYVRIAYKTEVESETEAVASIVD